MQNTHLYRNSCEPDSIENCGSHEYVCAENEDGWANGTCENGKCTASECILGMHVENGACEPDVNTFCNGTEIAILEDSANCGACGRYCDWGEYCYNGYCYNASIYPDDELYCNGFVVYPYFDSDNCGGCDILCDIGEYCLEGSCTNEPYNVETICFGEIVNPYTDENNCGGCGILCPSGQICSQGKCLFD